MTGWAGKNKRHMSKRNIWKKQIHRLCIIFTDDPHIVLSETLKPIIWIFQFVMVGPTYVLNNATGAVYSLSEKYQLKLENI